MSTIRLPRVTASLRADGTIAGLTEQKVLFVGNQQALGFAPPLSLQENVLTADDADVLFGARSPLAHAFRRARDINPQNQFDVIPIPEDGETGVQAQGNIVFSSGPANQDFELRVFVGDDKYTLNVAEGDTATVIGQTVADAITANSAVSFVGASNAAGDVTINSIIFGTFGNTIGIKVETDLPISTYGVAVAVTAMSGGAGDVDLTNVLDVIGERRYQAIVWQFTQSAQIDVVKDFLDSRFNVENDVLDGVAFISITDTFSNHLSYLTSQNSQSLSVNCDELIDESDHRGPAIFDIAFNKAAEFAAIRALRRTENAVLGSLVISRSARDSFGGIHQNSKPYFNTPFNSLDVPNASDGFTSLEISQLLSAGGWVLGPNRAFNTIIAGEVVTTYKTDNAGNPDPTFTFLNYVDTGTAAREYIVNNTRARFAQYRAVGGALINGLDSANEASVAAFVTQLNTDLGDAGLVNQGVGTLDGEQIDYDRLFRENLTVTLNIVTGTFSISAKLYIVTQFREAIYDLAIAFEV